MGGVDWMSACPVRFRDRRQPSGAIMSRQYNKAEKRARREGRIRRLKAKAAAAKAAAKK